MRNLSAALGAVIVGTLLSGSAMAQSGHVFGSIEGERFAYRSADDTEGVSPVDFRIAARRDEIEVEVVARRETATGVEGVILYLVFESREELSARTLAIADIVVAEEWSSAEEEPELFWYAERDDLDIVRLEGALASEGAGALSGEVASDRFCLHEWGDGYDPVPVLRASEMVCKSIDVGFALASADAPAQAPRQVEAEVLGRIEGRIGEESHSWVTVLPRRAEASATLGQLQPGNTDILRIQAYSPSSPDFLREQVLAITIVGEFGVGIRTGIAVPAEVMFQVERGIHYASRDGSAQAIVSALSLDGDEGEATISLEGRMCRVEGWTEIEDSCKSFDLFVRTEIVRARD